MLRLVRRGLQGLILRRGAGEGDGQKEGGGHQVGFGGRHVEPVSVRRAGGSERRRARERARAQCARRPPRVVGRRGASLLWSPPNARRLRLPANIELAPPPTPHAQSVTSCQLRRTRGGPRPLASFPPTHLISLSLPKPLPFHDSSLCSPHFPSPRETFFSAQHLSWATSQHPPLGPYSPPLLPRRMASLQLPSLPLASYQVRVIIVLFSSSSVSFPLRFLSLLSPLRPVGPPRPPTLYPPRPPTPSLALSLGLSRSAHARKRNHS